MFAESECLFFPVRISIIHPYSIYIGRLPMSTKVPKLPRPNSAPGRILLEHSRTSD
jgi:hypothetical protein